MSPDSLAAAPPSPPWIEVLVRDVVGLVQVPRLFWLALILLLLIQVITGVWWTEGEVNKARWPTLKRLTRDGFRTSLVLLSINIGGNAVPVLGWTIAVAWSGAIWLTIREIGRSASTAESSLRKLVDDMWSEVRRRNRLAMDGSVAAAPASGIPSDSPQAGLMPWETEQVPYVGVEGVPQGPMPGPAPDHAGDSPRGAGGSASPSPDGVQHGNPDGAPS